MRIIRKPAYRPLPTDWVPGAGLLYDHLDGGTFYAETRLNDTVAAVWRRLDGTEWRATITVAQFVAKVATR